MKFTLPSLVILSLVCAACATKQESILKEKGSAQSVEFDSSDAQQSVVGFRATSVRVSQNGNSSIPASCNIVGDGFKAKFKTPAIVNLPSYGKQTKPIQVNCELDGETHSEMVAPKNISAENRRANAVGAGVLFAGVLGGAVAGAVSGEKEGDAYSYKPITLKAD